MRDQFERQLDGYLAGELKSEALREFEALLEAQPELRAEVELQRSINTALRERCQAPRDFAASARAMAEGALAAGRTGTLAPAHPTVGRIWVRRLAIAAVIMLGVFGAWSTWQFLTPGPAPYPDTGPKRTPVAAYHEIIAAGFEPAWVCKNDQEFLENISKGLRQDFLIDQSDDNIRVVGLAYANTLSPWTVMILSYVNEQPVVVFADSKLADRNVPTPTTPALKWFKRDLGEVVLYELTPFDEPMILPRVYEPADGAPAPEA